jgi:muramoyltetrapeptide carboxypeptidase
VKPGALRRGSTLAVVTPASAAKVELVQAGMERLEGLGYKTKLMPHALDRGPLYYAGTAEARAGDLMAAFADKAIDGIVCTRGGWGSAELLPLLDAAVVRANPKVFVGYSDHTSLHTWLAREAGLVTFYGPMVAADFGRADGFDRASWGHAVGGDSEWALTASDGLRVLRAGVAEGMLTGGCISILAEGLGTPYAMLPATVDASPQRASSPGTPIASPQRASSPGTPIASPQRASSPGTPDAPRVLFLEDIGTKPYQWDRMLLHLRYAGMLEQVSGIVFGDMRQCVAAEEDALLEAAILHALRDFAGPIAIGLRSGHVDTPNVTVPLGVRVRLDLREEPRLEFLEKAVVSG